MILSGNILFAQDRYAIKTTDYHLSFKREKRTIDSLNDLADTLCLHKIPEGTRMAWKALRLSIREQYHQGIGDASHSLGLTKFRRENDSAIYYFRQARSAYEKEYPGFEKMSLTLNNLSRTYDEMQLFDSALHYARIALSFLESHVALPATKNKWRMYTFGATANAHAGKSRYDSANDYYLKAVKLAEETNNEKMLAVYFKGLATIQSQLENYEKAIEYGHKAVKYSREDCRGLSIALASLAGMYSRIKDYAQADIMADSSINTGRQCNVWNSIGRNYGILGNSQFLQKNYPAALHYFKTGIRLGIQYNNSKASIGSLYRRLGEAYELMDSLPQAKDSYMKALQMAEGNDEMKAAVYLALSNLFFKQGNTDSAYRYVQQYNNFRDIVYTNEKIKAITELNTRYETEKKDQQILLMLKEKLLQAALVSEQLQQLAKDRLEKREQQLEIANYELQTDKNEQQLRIQQLDLENSRMKQAEQQILLANADSRLQIEKNQKAIAIDEARQKRNWIIMLLSSFACLSVIALLLFNRYKLLKGIQNRDALLKQRERISRELHDEVGATLSGIAMYSHLAKEQMNNPATENIEKSLHIIQQNAGEMVNKLNDIVWLIHPGNDNLQQLLQRLEDYAVQMGAVKKIRVSTNINGQYSQVLLPAESRRNIYLLFKEAINNAVKYSECTVLRFIVDEKPEGLTLTLTDNGKGFDIAHIKKGNGIENMQNRAREINGSFYFTSIPGLGTTIELNLPQRGIGKAK